MNSLSRFIGELKGYWFGIESICIRRFAGPIFPPGCMKGARPALRTSSVCPSGLINNAAVMRMVFNFPPCVATAELDHGWHNRVKRKRNYPIVAMGGSVDDTYKLAQEVFD
ncbi:hypothetical protein [Sinorhizobium fredii]|uniref:hypothetical protein n=1 Tax=Rhizobium fredii TaxID=380 RepID=UPI0035154FCD